MVKFFKTGSVDEWMDLETKNVTGETNSRMLGFLHKGSVDLVHRTVEVRQFNHYSSLLHRRRCGLDDNSGT
jgi:hypothetical protein